MKIELINSTRFKIKRFYLESIVIMFMPGEKFGAAEDGKALEIYATEEQDGLRVYAIFKSAGGGVIHGEFIPADRKDLREDGLTLAVTGVLFDLLSGIMGFKPEWGLMTGIRPCRLLGELEKRFGTAEKAAEYLRSAYRVDERKTELALNTYRNGKDSLTDYHTDDKACSLYISIPFCPSRCRYCSFTAFSSPVLNRLIPGYIQKLTCELEIIGGIIVEKGYKLTSVYIGGGTPSVLESGDIGRLLSKIHGCFDMSGVSEFTFESGRPETVTEEKLRIMKQNGVMRICINPQTLDDRVLGSIGRAHTESDFYKAYELAVSSGIPCINTDMIVGLPGDSGDNTVKTAQKLIALQPQNITVHTMCVKNAAYLRTDNPDDTSIYHPNDPRIGAALDAVYSALDNAGYLPYYMYKQKYTAGNLENTGFTAPGYACVYNICMMDEVHTVFGAGAGAVTKHVDGNKISRIINPKYPQEYLRSDFKICGFGR